MSWCQFKWMICQLFCRASFSLTSYRWFDQHLQAFHTRQHQDEFLQKNSWEHQGLNLWLLGEKCKRYLCYAAAPICQNLNWLARLVVAK